MTECTYKPSLIRPHGRVRWEKVFPKELLDRQDIVYLLTFPNGKEYVGWTSQAFRKRMQQHWSRATSGYTNLYTKNSVHYNKPISLALRTMGMPSVTVLMDNGSLFDEQRFMYELDTHFPRGLNVN